MKENKSKRLSPVEKQEITDLWEQGELSTDEIAQRVGRDKSTVVKFVSRAELVKGSKRPATKDAIRHAVENMSVEDEALRISRIRETQEENYKLGTLIQKLVGAEMVRCRTEGVSQSKGFDSYRALLIAAQALKTSQQVRERSLGLDKDSDPADKPLPTLGLQLISEEQVKEIQERNKVQSPIDQAMSIVEQELKPSK